MDGHEIVTASGMTAPSMIAYAFGISRSIELQRNAQSGGNGPSSSERRLLLPALNPEMKRRTKNEELKTPPA